MIEFLMEIDLNTTYSILDKYNLIDIYTKKEIIIQSPSKDIPNVIEATIKSNKKQNGLHIYQMYK
jgi:hypothetical protein